SFRKKDIASWRPAADCECPRVCPPPHQLIPDGRGDRLHTFDRKARFVAPRWVDHVPAEYHRAVELSHSSVTATSRGESTRPRIHSFSNNNPDALGRGNPIPRRTEKTFSSGILFQYFSTVHSTVGQNFAAKLRNALQRSANAHCRNAWCSQWCATLRKAVRK